MCKSNVLKGFVSILVQQSLVFVTKKLGICIFVAIYWSRWFNFLILLQCSICSFHRKNADKFVGSTLEMEDMHCFCFVMLYGLNSNNVMYSTSNQFLYVNKNLLHFLNIKQQLCFKNWFVFIPWFIGSALEKMVQNNVKDKGLSRVYSWFL